MDSSVQATLGLIRRARNQNDVEAAFQHVARCAARSTSLQKTGTPTGTVSQEERESLCTVSILVGALCRRVEQLFQAQTANTAYETEPNEEASWRAKYQVETSMNVLWEALEPLRTRLQKCTRAPSTPSVPSPPLPPKLSSRGSGLLGAPASSSAADIISDIMLYGMGELSDYYTRRCAEARQSLITLLHRPRWEPSVVTEKLLWLQRLQERATAVPLRVARGPSHAGAASASGVTATNATSPLRDPLSRLPLQLPARGPRCAHVDVFDLTSLVRAAQQQSQTPRPNGGATSAGTEVTCPVCRSVFELTDVCVDVHARTALVAFYAEHPIDSVDADRFCLEWNVDADTVKVAARERRGEKRTISSVDPEDADAEDEESAGAARKAAKME